MLGVANRSATKTFNDGILTTFGKLDEFEIEELDGQPEKLVVALMKYYGWSDAGAREKVDQFLTRIASVTR